MECKIEGDEIVMRMKIDALPAAWMSGPFIENEYDPEDEENIPPSITDPYVFAPDLLVELNYTDEAGTSLAMECFDKAMERAIENGADGVSD